MPVVSLTSSPTINILLPQLLSRVAIAVAAGSELVEILVVDDSGDGVIAMIDVDVVAGVEEVEVGALFWRPGVALGLALDR